MGYFPGLFSLTTRGKKLENYPIPPSWKDLSKSGALIYLAVIRTVPTMGILFNCFLES